MRESGAKAGKRWRNARRCGAAVALAVSCAACASHPSDPPGAPQAEAAPFPNIGYASWTDAEPPYRVYPGDELDVSVPSAPELSKTVTIQPDGRINLPLIHGVMVADQTVSQVEATLGQAYSSQLLRPEIYVGIKAVTPLKVFVGGEVGKPGIYDMPGDINALQAVIEAGGFTTSAARDRVVIIRRSADGRAMMRTADLKHPLSQPANADLVPLRRFDIVFVPRTGLANAGVFMKQLEDLVPGNVGFEYAVTNTAKIF
jgi:polysaccharide export outer membrane protein